MTGGYYWKGRKDNPTLGWWKGKTGLAHPLSKPVRTPHGSFESIRAAARHYGVDNMTIVKWANAGADGFKDFAEWGWL